MRDLPYELWEPVVGLEIHVQLNTKSKLFSTAPNHFGDEPNVNITTVCTGQPGALPVLNKEAVRKAVQFGLAIDGKVALFSKFDRKSYFYPDSPRNFQITQFERPIVTGGQITAEVDGQQKVFKINRAHLEDDAGMLKHFTTFAGVDYNRAGAPLIEIVSEPCIHSAKEASAYATAIRAIMLYLDASDGNMEEGSLRMDANISVRPKGSTELRPRIEIKNMNSFSFLEMAIEAEMQRQIGLYTDHPNTPFIELIPPGTYRWDPESKETVLMRRKESADDYRYFPEPDLVPVILTQEYVDQIRDVLPELPQDRFRRYTSDLGLTPYSATILINDKPLCDYFESAMKLCPSPRQLCNWITVEFTGRLKESGQTLCSIGIKPQHVAKLVELIETNKITGRIAKQVADDMVASPGLDPETIVKNNPDYQPVSDTSAIEPLVDQVLAENPQSIADYKAGREKAFAFLVGQVMKLTRGKASPAVVNELILKKIK
ncbi:MAG: Asp-tRNA(Asn)/Glu-tRNA(Gln) amidotransferase subunit GatB [Verrucomicrobia bacterium]|nr:Asp-tRNA(Asn)/Glu-tRNA(Gln) amidotransferase subunit GatB [Verrucomicrobiota bacterium]